MIYISNLSYLLLKLLVPFMIIVGSFILIILLIVIFAKKFNCQDKIFNGRVFSFLGSRKNFKKGIKPSITDGVLIYTLSLIALIYVGSFLQLCFDTGGLIATEAIMIAIPILYSIYIKSDLKNTFSFKIPKLKHLLGSFSVWFGGYFIINITTQILLALFPEQSKVLEAVNTSVMMDSLLASLIIVAVMPAICEEFLFRGFLLGAFRGESKISKVLSMIIVGILFGTMHLNFIRIVPTAMLGILFGYCVIASKSIWTGVFMHFLNNGFAVMTLYLNEHYLKIPVEAQTTYTMPTISSIVFILGIGILFVYFGSLCFREKNKNDIII